MPGRLKACWSEWAKLYPNALVTSIIRDGYTLQWRDGQPPPPMWHKNGQAAYDNEAFVTAKVEEVVLAGIMRECRREDLHCILAMNVLPKPNSTKKRLILNGSPLKPYELRRRFKLEQLWQHGREIFSGCTHGGIIDLSNAFYHIDMAEASKKYIGCEWLGKFYQYNSMPQGIHSAPFIFTEVTIPMVRCWRSKGIRVLKYLDDFPSAARTALLYRLHMAFMLEHCKSLGWLIQLTKVLGHPEPCTILPALGTQIYLSDQQFRLAEDKVLEIQELAKTLASSRTFLVRVLSRLAGLIISRAHCLGPAARMRTRAMYINIEARLKPHERTLEHKSSLGWSRAVPRHADTLVEFQFWITNTPRVNGQPIQRCQQIRVIEVDTLSDAGARGWGGVLYLPPGSHAASASLLLAARRSLPDNMTLEAIHSVLHDGIRVCGTFSSSEMAEC